MNKCSQIRSYLLSIRRVRVEPMNRSISAILQYEEIFDNNISNKYIHSVGIVHPE